ncbi:unnamed protein product [Rhizoctonia solani]|uniref:NADAR domain-containing protein n=1 Tax=Rhizoctonia solani TaxID=456999 RepID=A0A8H2WQZ5_9AGAM|nr:unnamed protein product [Rhizoctonia solani]CAE6483775.1 unnamed protein product [Rhizoctonia solani]
MTHSSFLALRHELRSKALHQAFPAFQVALTDSYRAYLFSTTYPTMPPTSHKATKKGSKSKQKGKRPRSPSKSETEKGSDGSQIITDDAVYFFRPKEAHGYLSQWYASPFTDGTYSYDNAEQYMMHRKGILFAPDSPVTSAILETTNPRDIKALGRMIPNFDDTVWKRERLNIVTEGSRLKFRQSEALKVQLLATGVKELVEASPFDRIWGVGFGAKQAPMKRDKWGENLLGKALVAVRRELQEEAIGGIIDSEPELGPSSDSLGSQQALGGEHSLEDQRLPARGVRVSPSPTQAKVIFSLLFLNLILFYI